MQFAKYIEEDKSIGLDWEKRLNRYPAGESIASSSFSIVSPASPALVVGTDSIDGLVTLVRISAGLEDETYHLKNVVTLQDSGETRSWYFTVRVASPV